MVNNKQVEPVSVGSFCSGIVWLWLLVIFIRHFKVCGLWLIGIGLLSWSKRRPRGRVEGIDWYLRFIWRTGLVLKESHVVRAKLLQFGTWIVGSSKVLIERCISTDGTYEANQQDCLLSLIRSELRLIRSRLAVPRSRMGLAHDRNSQFSRNDLLTTLTN